MKIQSTLVLAALGLLSAAAAHAADPIRIGEVNPYSGSLAVYGLEVTRGHEIAVNLLRKVQLQIAVNDDFVEPTINAIVEGGRSGEKGEIGDGKIFVLPMEECVRIRTGERGSEAI